MILASAITSGKSYTELVISGGGDGIGAIALYRELKIVFPTAS
jgi:hypothetical protein